jgi:hypothetical protein
MGERRSVYRVLVEKPEEKRLFERPGCGWDVNININIREVGWDMKGIDLAQDRHKWRDLVNAVLNHRIPYNAGMFFD